MVLVRHPDGEQDLLCPTAWCDVCGEEMTGELQDGCCDLYAYKHPREEDARYEGFCAGREPVPLYLVHGGRCFESLKNENGLTLSHMPTDWLIVHLAQNMGKGTSEGDWLKLHRWVTSRNM